jgi:hypothetical protein
MSSSSISPELVAKAEALSGDLLAYLDFLWTTPRPTSKEKKGPIVRTTDEILALLRPLEGALRGKDGDAPRPALTPSHPLFPSLSRTVFLLTSLALPRCMLPIFGDKEGYLKHLEQQESLRKLDLEGVSAAPAASTPAPASPSRRPVFPLWSTLAYENVVYKYERGVLDFSATPPMKDIAEFLFALDWDRGALEAEALRVVLWDGEGEGAGLPAGGRAGNAPLWTGAMNYLAYEWFEQGAGENEGARPR